MSEFSSSSVPPLDKLREMIAQLDTETSDSTSLDAVSLPTTQDAIRPASDASNTETSSTPSLAESIFEHSSDAMFLLQDFVCISCNPASCRLFGCDCEQIYDENFLLRVSQLFDVEQDWITTVIEHLTRNNAIEFEIQRNDADVWCELSLRKIEFNGGQNVLAVARDISKRKHAELELSRNIEFVQCANNALPEPVSVKSPNLDFFLVNDSFC
jgi:PAS domain S-box-containing protein